MRSRVLGLTLVLIVGCRPAGPSPDDEGSGTGPVPSVSPAEPLGWPYVAGDAGARRWSRASQITPENAGDLERAWIWETGEVLTTHEASGETLFPDKFEASPLAIGDTLFLSTPFNRVVALDGVDGTELWSFDTGATDAGLIANDHAGFVHRGVATWVGDGARRIFIASRWRLFAIDAATGEPIESFGSGGSVDLGADLRWPVDRTLLGNTSPPTVSGDLVVVGSAIGDNVIADRDPPGAVQAYDARTGERRWRWDPVPAPGTPERDTWEGDALERTGHANVWSEMTVDSVRGLLYVPVSAASNDWYGGRRLGDNLFTQSIVCLELATGRLVWYRQLIRHDLWDYDPASPPVLVTVDAPEGPRDAVFVAGKTGYLYAFDRVTGEPLWPTEDRPAPESTVPGERTAESQPHPTWPEPFARQGFSVDDLVDFTPEIRALAEAFVDSLVMGEMFTPPSLQGTVVNPGWIGGAGWGSTAVDPERGLIFVKGSNRPALGRLVPDEPIGFRLDPSMGDPTDPLHLVLEGRSSRLPWRDDERSVRLPIIKPPYGTLSAYDLASGERLWQVTLGDMLELRAHSALRDLDLPPLGVAGPTGAVATAGGVLFITGGGRTLYAIEADSGRTLWSEDLGAIGYSNPMTFVDTNGMQTIVVATGLGEGARLQAFRLPSGDVQ
ncbi:MAG: PQQ-binding-like beta-propeller repeat protein [Gemmatimonadetes bacterium]|nr:PQQ-binding-like beta-propeller repeat protein [Gemmatimonadota bacterium]